MRVPSVIIPAAARRGLRWGEPKDSSTGRAVTVRRLRDRSHSILGTGIPELKGRRLLPLHARRRRPSSSSSLLLLLAKLGAPAARSTLPYSARGRCVGNRGGRGQRQTTPPTAMSLSWSPDHRRAGALVFSSATRWCSTNVPNTLFKVKMVARGSLDKFNLVVLLILDSRRWICCHTQ